MDYYQPAKVAGASAFLKSQGWRLDARWSVRPDWMPEKQDWDGVLISCSDQDSFLHRVEKLGIPLVHLSGWQGKRALPRIDWDEHAAVCLALDEFQANGLSRLLIPNYRNFPVNYRSRRALWIEGRRRGFEIEEMSDWDFGENWTESLRAVARRIAAASHPIALYCPHSAIIFSLLDHLALAGVSIPQDLSIIVFDKDVQKTAELASPSLTGVMPDFWQQGFQAARTLYALIHGSPPVQPIQRIPPLGLVRRESTGARRIEDVVVAKVTNLIENYPVAELQISHLVAVSGVSRRTLEQRFVAETGETMHKAVMRRRIREAKQAIGFQGLSLEQIAFQLGYSSLSYFSTSFKRETGLSPREWRERHEPV